MGKRRNPLVHEPTRIVLHGLFGGAVGVCGGLYVGGLPGAVLSGLSGVVLGVWLGDRLFPSPFDDHESGRSRSSGFGSGIDMDLDL